MWPTKSGVIVERRDQVLIGFFTAACIHLVDFLEEMLLDERTFFEASVP